MVTVTVGGNDPTFVIVFQATADDQLLCGQLLGSVGAIDPAYFTGQAFDGLGFRV